MHFVITDVCKASNSPLSLLPCFSASFLKTLFYILYMLTLYALYPCHFCKQTKKPIITNSFSVPTYYPSEGQEISVMY